MLEIDASIKRKWELMYENMKETKSLQEQLVRQNNEIIEQNKEIIKQNKERNDYLLKANNYLFRLEQHMELSNEMAWRFYQNEDVYGEEENYIYQELANETFNKLDAVKNIDQTKPIKLKINKNQ